MTEEEQNKMEKDILFQIDMQLYDEFNEKLCEMNDNLGTIYTYKDIMDLEEAEKDKEIKLLREAVKKLQADIEIKDKVIDLANKIIDNYENQLNISNFKNKEEIKEFLFKKVEEEK